MANPRKFSEKIALHTQKQAEETAAFEAVMREVSGATRPSYQKHLQISQHLSGYHGGSLPNVNQISSSNAIDLQNALHNLENIKQGRPSLAEERIQRERSRQLHGRVRPLHIDKRLDSSPYGSTYLSPPPDASWRRTSSDSALHASTMGEPMSNIRASPIKKQENDVQLQHDSLHLKAFLAMKKAQSRPKSCEVPNINIFPSQEPDSGLPNIPITNNTGSLPDLTTIHFPSPMVTPLDIDEQQQTYQAALASVTNQSHIAMATGQVIPPSPTSRRRHGCLSPLVLNEADHLRYSVPTSISQMMDKRSIPHQRGRRPMTTLVQVTF